MSKQTADATDEVRAKRLVLVDDDGKERAVLQMVNGQPVFGLNDERGKERVTLRLLNGDPCLQFSDKNGVLGLYAYVDSDHRSYLGIIGPQWNSYISLTAAGDAGHQPATTFAMHATMSPKGRREFRVETSDWNSPTGGPGPTLSVYTPTTTYVSNFSDVYQPTQGEAESMFPEFVRIAWPTDNATDTGKDRS